MYGSVLGWQRRYDDDQFGARRDLWHHQRYRDCRGAGDNSFGCVVLSGGMVQCWGITRPASSATELRRIAQCCYGLWHHQRHGRCSRQRYLRSAKRWHGSVLGRQHRRRPRQRHYDEQLSANDGLWHHQRHRCFCRRERIRLRGVERRIGSVVGFRTHLGLAVARRTGQSSVPVTFAGITSATAIAAGEARMCIVERRHHSMLGFNAYGELGNGTTTDPPCPSRSPASPTP